MKKFLRPFFITVLALIAATSVAMAAISIVPNGGTGVGTITGIIKGNGTSPFTAATPGTDFQSPISLTTTGTSGAATFTSNVLNIPQYSGGTVPGGLNAQLQYNNFGVFGGITGATTDGTSVSLTTPHFLNPTINGAGTGLATLTYPNTSTSVSIGFPATAGTLALTSQLTSGTVTSVATDSSLTGGPITTTGTLGLNLAHTNIFTASQQFPNIGVNMAATSNIGVDIFADNTTITQGVRVQGGATTTQAVGAYVTGDANLRFAFRADGRIVWGNGTAGADTNLYRTGVGILNTDGAFTVGGNITAPTFNLLPVSLGTNSISTNVAIGTSALVGANTGSGFNLAIGSFALQSNTSGTFNTAIGSSALRFNVNGTLNVGIGVSALTANTGSNNTVIGTNAAITQTNASGNIAIGFSAGKYTTASNEFYINNVDQTNTANDKAFSLLYGKFSGTAGSLTAQQLTVNGALNANGNTTITGLLGANVSTSIINTNTWTGAIENPGTNQTVFSVLRPNNSVSSLLQFVPFGANSTTNVNWFMGMFSSSDALSFGTYDGSTSITRFSISDTGNLTVGGSILSGAGIGYQTGIGAGGTVTQITSKSTGVTLNTYTGTITMNNASLATNTNVTFTVTDSKMTATDVVSIQHDSGGTIGDYIITPNTSAAGSFNVTVRNVNTLGLSEAIVLRFAIIKGSIN